MAQATLMIKKVRRQGGLLASTDNDNSIVRPSRTTVPVFPTLLIGNDWVRVEYHLDC